MLVTFGSQAADFMKTHGHHVLLQNDVTCGDVTVVMSPATQCHWEWVMVSLFAATISLIYVPVMKSRSL